MTTPFDSPEHSVPQQSGTQTAAGSEPTPQKPASPERPAGSRRWRAPGAPQSMMTVALIVAMLLLLFYAVPAVFLGVDEVAAFLNLAR